VHDNKLSDGNATTVELHLGSWAPQLLSRKRTTGDYSRLKLILKQMLQKPPIIRTTFKYIYNKLTIANFFSTYEPHINKK